MTRLQIQAILDQHDDALRGLRAASTAFDAAMVAMDDVLGGVRNMLGAVQAANHQQGLAIDAVIGANRAALRLLNNEDSQ